VIFLTFSLAIAIIDQISFRIPDILPGLCVCALVLHDLVFERASMVSALAAALVSGAVFFAVFSLKGGLGFGDVKYSAVIGYFLRLDRVFTGLLLACFAAAAVWCIGKLLFKWNRTTRFPFGPCLALGACAAAVLPSPLEYLP
jgi:prepilin signal peptidase PulO-like enzyme (type II secretory pathway)